jgi:RNA recognition motif-containing protein
VLDALRDMGINNIEELTLMEDPQLEGVNRGFSFIEFSTHKEALKAFRRLQQTDATFGTDRSAKVAWAQPLNEPDEETMSQVKSVFVDGMPPAWDEEKVREHFGKFGEIDRIVLARNMSAAKRKDFGFVNYVEREAAMACIDAISNSGIVDGEIKIKMKVMLAKPQVKSKPAKGGVRGGYPLGFKGDHRVGSVPAQPGRGGGGGRGGMHDGTYDGYAQIQATQTQLK